MAAAIMLLSASCKKESTPEFQAGDKGSLDIEFDNVVGSTNLQLTTGSYTNANGDAFTVTLFKYYISNIVLKNQDGTTYTVPKDSSYFLIDEAASSQLITLNNIPAGNYTGVDFVIGVDSLKCTAPLDQRTGALDPSAAAADMYWSWNSGYIFVKMEGVSTVATSSDKKFRYHIGGFGGYSSTTINNIKKASLTIPGNATAQVRKDKAENPHIHIMADASKVMNGSTNVSIAANSTVMFSAFSVNIANNYASMFTIDHVHND